MVCQILKHIRGEEFARSKNLQGSRWNASANNWILYGGKPNRALKGRKRNVLCSHDALGPVKQNELCFQTLVIFLDIFLVQCSYVFYELFYCLNNTENVIYRSINVYVWLCRTGKDIYLHFLSKYKPRNPSVIHLNSEAKYFSFLLGIHSLELGKHFSSFSHQTIICTYL